jgi:hypothetical protein
MRRRSVGLLKWGNIQGIWIIRRLLTVYRFDEKFPQIPSI